MDCERVFPGQPQILQNGGELTNDAKTEENDNDIIYKLEDVPPWYISCILGLQHYLTMFSAATAVPYIITPFLCIADDSPYRGRIISTTFFVSGLCSFLQTTFGTRLPIVQGPSTGFLAPILAILTVSQWQCPSEQVLQNMTAEEKDEVWMSRIREVQGAVIVGALFEVLVGLTGLIGYLMKWISPLSITPTITLIGLSLFNAAAKQSSGNWWIASLTMILLITFSQYLADFTIPGITYSKEKGFHSTKILFFKLFPVILTILVSWLICMILTVTNTLPEGNAGRTDLRLAALKESRWIEIPYPGQWGMPTFNVGPALGVIAGVTASIIESVGDYFACAKIAGAPRPPIHAVNRGIMMEGICCFLSGIWGTVSGLTSYSSSIGAMAITKIGSRRVIQFASIIIILIGSIGKVGMLFIAIPTPIMGGIFFVIFAIITGIGLSNLQYINLNSSRNLFILGFSIFMGLAIPSYLQTYPEAIQTGNDLADQIIGILLKTNMFIGGFLGCLLDNTIPASEKDRGLESWRSETILNENEEEMEIPAYNMAFGMNLIRKIKFFEYFPISPTYKVGNTACGCLTRRKKKADINYLHDTEMTH